MLNIDKTEAVRLFLSLNAHKNDQVLRGHYFSEFLGYAMMDHFDELKPVLDRMMASAIGEVARCGAEWATLMYLHTGKMKMEVDSCLVGSERYERGSILITSNLPFSEWHAEYHRWRDPRTVNMLKNDPTWPNPRYYTPGDVDLTFVRQDICTWKMQRSQ